MGSSRPPDRSLGSGISFPQWMKGKVDSRFDFDQSTFSPPSHDDSFFYISYNKLGAGQSSSSTAVNNTKEGFQSINSVLSEAAAAPVTTKSNIPIKNVNIDLSKHPIACQQSFTSTFKGEQESTVSNKLINKSLQGSDEFENSAVGLCGKSIVSVANRIMSTSMIKKINDSNSNDTSGGSEIIKRRGSKSLPVSPINSPISTPDSSPKSRRRVIQNRFFTGGLVPDKSSSSSANHQGWFLSSILTQSRDIIGHSKINEEDDEIIEANISPPPVRSLSRKKSISSQNLTYIGGINVPEDIKKSNDNSSSLKVNVEKLFQPEQQSELREMNFLSPTSM